MKQMVLPQTPAPGMQNDAGASKTGPGRDSGTGETRYESVSRAEQKRLDRQKSERKDLSENARKDDPKNAEAANSVHQVSKGDSSQNQVKSTGKLVDKGTGESLGTAPEMEATTALTFAELQALLPPAAAVPGNAVGSSANNSTLIPGSELFAGLAEGKPGQLAPGSNGSPVAGLQLPDALVPVRAEKAVAMDPASLLTGARLESAMELVSQQNASNTAGKLAAEVQAPLRSYATSVDVPVNHAEWGDKLAGKLSWLTAKNLSVAEIHLTPPDMGPMEVRVRVQNDQANITVHAANPVVREQLELHSHRLRDMLGEQGLSLAQFDVSDNSRNSSGEQGADEGGAEGASPGPGSALSGLDGGDEGVQSGSLDLSWNGAIDVFA
ncbi:flagellar hook-length control protein FliK [Marinobacter salexigens]|uniref:flagellar hook-length control protein FliK n=1 Tax=Marinobacter salexigens TaxID=1925763 RepID=UPI000C286E05|nr:flagellar hook-length control protein FliK [Marinobacter salexigens]